MDKHVLYIYSDHLTCSFGLTAATGLSALLEGTLSHDKITASYQEATSLPPICGIYQTKVRQVQREDAVQIVDENIEEKPYTDESKLIYWHWDHYFYKGGRYPSRCERTLI
jgi:hypothetical protein